jgi:carboxylesterase 2
MRIQCSVKNSCAALLACIGTFSSAALYDQVVDTKHGGVQGYRAFNSTPSGNLTNWEDITVWKGIPFAASTAGNNRWRAPQPAEAWNSTLDARTFGPICPGAKTMTTGSERIAEDCLSLNIWSAAKSPGARLPVVMWSYPAQSSASDALFDGGGMASKEIVFVNYNYRTSSLGWLAHPELSEERLATTGSDSSGNYGMLDQFAALKWICENIASFGGDPEHITVMGQSAGSAATYHIVNSELTKGLIVGAIIESGVRDVHDPLDTSIAENYITLNTSLAQGESFLASLNVSTIKEARALPYSDVLTGFQNSAFQFTATLDHYAIPDTYLNTLLKGAANDVPIMTGNTKDESGATYGLNISLATYEANLNATYSGQWVKRFFEAYPANDTTAGGQYNSQWTDRSKVGTYLWTQLWYKASKQPVWTYIWDHAPPGQTAGAYHESEINYVLNNLYGTDLPWTANDYIIAGKMNGYWANFIKTGNPNGNGLVNWLETSNDETVQRVGDAFERVKIATTEKIKLYKEWFTTLPSF